MFLNFYLHLSHYHLVTLRVSASVLSPFLKFTTHEPSSFAGMVKEIRVCPGASSSLPDAGIDDGVNLALK